MNLAKFVKTMEDELKKFSTFWADKSAEEPDIFPIRMELEEWLEQLQAWEESSND